MQRRCLVLLERLYTACGDAHFAHHLPELMPPLLALLTADKTPRRVSSRAAIHALGVFRDALGQHVRETV